eukprot:3157395-Amphidinium_carterae.1
MAVDAIGGPCIGVSAHVLGPFWYASSAFRKRLAKSDYIPGGVQPLALTTSGAGGSPCSVVLSRCTLAGGL